jgi:uncharacterized protein
VSVEVRPFGVRCNIGCQYCYQNPQRDAGNVLASYDMEAMMAALEKAGRSFVLFGGEPLLMPIADLEQLWAFGLERFGSNGIQTNGTLITDRHLELFRQYKVHVGISIDGPGELNDVRWAGSLDKTRKATAKTHEAIRKLCLAGKPPSLIITLHRNNATAEHLPRMLQWVRELDELGVCSARLHLLEVDHASVRDKYALSNDENLEALRAFHGLERDLRQLRFDLFKDMRNLLLAEDKRSACVWMACDPYTTKAVQGLEGSGQRSNCGRTNKDGIDFVKSDLEGFERYLALYLTPQEFGGCQGCRFFLMCKGQCPGTAIDGDWRNRTEHCSVWMSVYEQLEQELLDEGRRPLSLDPMREEIESELVRQWATGSSANLATLVGRRGRDSSAEVAAGEGSIVAPGDPA